MSENKMKAVICTAYGSPEVLTLKNIEKPVPGENEVLIKIVATAVNSGDVRVRGLNVEGIFKIIMRFVLGFKRPRQPVLGLVLSGRVEEVGKNVKKLRPGDEVFASTGFKMGAYAQYITLPEKGNVMLKPLNASSEESAAILFGGMSAIYFLEKAGIEPNRKVLIYGATGSVGAAAVEIAKHFKAHVTAVCGEQGVDLAKNLGSDAIMVYNSQDFRRTDEKFDIVFDAVGKTKKKECKELLKPGGKYVTVGAMDVAKETTAQMSLLKKLFENGELHAWIDRTYSMEEIVEAHRYVDTGRKKANVVVRIP